MKVTYDSGSCKIWYRGSKFCFKNQIWCNTFTRVKNCSHVNYSMKSQSKKLNLYKEPQIFQRSMKVAWKSFQIVWNSDITQGLVFSNLWLTEKPFFNKSNIYLWHSRKAKRAKVVIISFKILFLQSFLTVIKILYSTSNSAMQNWPQIATIFPSTS